MSSTAQLDNKPQRQLTLFDSTCIIVGIIIGAGIYKTGPFIASNTSSVGTLMAVWAIGGLIAMLGALCYAELATAYPRAGGDYVYLTRAYGRRTGFLFAWAEFWILRPGNVGMLAFVFATYARELFPLRFLANHSQFELMFYAASAVLLMSALNILSVRAGKWTQNVLTVVKIAGLLAIFVTAVFTSPAAQPTVALEESSSTPNFHLAMIMVVFCYGGWNEMSYVAAEVRNPRKNIVRALVFGTIAVTVVYLLVNFAFIRILGFKGLQESGMIAADAVRKPMGETGARAISALVCVSCLGAINGMVFTGSRIFYAVGTEHKFYRWLGTWNSKAQAPIRALLVQLAATIGLIVGFGWYADGFTGLLYFTAPIYWSFAFLVGVSLFVLRWRKVAAEPDAYRVILFPVVPAIFCVACLFLIHSSLVYAIHEAIENRAYEPLWAFAFLAVGVVMSFFDPPLNTAI